jgi:hypothetical protein
MIGRRVAALTVSLLAAACAEPPRAPSESETTWRSYRNADGRDLLAHATIAKCYVDTTPPQDFNQPGFEIRRERKNIGGSLYDVANVYRGREFWMSVYRAAGAPTPLLGVYSEGACRDAAERMIEVVSKRKGPA